MGSMDVPVIIWIILGVAALILLGFATLFLTHGRERWILGANSPTGHGAEKKNSQTSSVALSCELLDPEIRGAGPSFGGHVWPIPSTA